MDLTQRIPNYVVARSQFEKLEKALFDDIRAVFAKEIPVLNSKLPSGYSIADYSINGGRGSDDKPSVILIPKWRDIIVRQFSEFRDLDVILAEDYARIEKKYGFEVAGFGIKDQIP